MVRVETDTQSIQNLFKKNTNLNGDVFDGDRISIESDFQRGDEETGVWEKKRKQGFIDSIQKNYPTGILTFVKDHTSAAAYQDPWATLDGGNRFRAIRDYMLDKFDVNGKKYSELDPNEKAVFDNMLIPCQWLAIERQDPPETIAEMFTRLNTSAKSLSPGELIKAHGWKKNVFEIELAKAIIMDKWKSSINDETTFTGCCQRIGHIRQKWCGVFRELSETKRCDNLAMMCGYICSSKQCTFSAFDKRYEILKPSFDDNIPSRDVITMILNKIEKLLDVVERFNSISILGSRVMGMPSQKSISPIWKRICEGTDYPGLDDKIVSFYNRIFENESLRNQFNSLHIQIGEQLACRVEGAIEFIESVYEDEE